MSLNSQLASIDEQVVAKVTKTFGIATLPKLRASFATHHSKMGGGLVLRFMILFFFFVGLRCGTVAAADAVNSGQDALRKTRAPWYDAEADDVRIIAKRKSTAAGDRQDWRKQTQRPEWSVDWDWDWDWGWGNRAGGGSWSSWFSSLSFGQILQMLAFLLLFIVIAVLLYYFLRSLPYFQRKEDTPGALLEERTDEERIENLPIQPVNRKGDFLSMAESCYQSGKYGDAIVYLFSHRLLQLDRAGYIRLTRGKTNRQYLYEIADSKTLYSILGKTIVCFEDVFFGKHDLAKDRFEESWNANLEFDSLIQRALS